MFTLVWNLTILKGSHSHVHPNLVYADVTVFVPSMLIVNEEDGMVQVCATLSAVQITERNFTITLATSNGTGRWRG